MSEELVTIEVDGVPLSAPKGEMLIRVTDKHGIEIPRFCYHDKLPIAANCRMCLVEVEKAPKPLPACATPIADGMKVFTRSPKAIAAQRGSMEFLLINHPLDCPICEQGGECELQDQAMGYGAPFSRFVEQKRAVMAKNIGPLIRTDFTRCIHCTRCVRFGENIAGMPELGLTGRGEFSEIGTYIEKSLVSELSANVIDLCPVGALTHKPSLHGGRSWEMVEHPLVAPHDAVGSNVYMHTLRKVIKRVVPRANESINEIWLADRDRFSYQAVHSEDRLERPMVRRDGEWVETDWETALETAAAALRQVCSDNGAEQLGVLASPNATVEELYLLQRIGRGLGTHNIDHRVAQGDFSDQANLPVHPGLGRSLASFEAVDAALLVGCHSRMEAPLFNHRLRKAALKGANVAYLNPAAYQANFPLSGQITVRPDAMVDGLVNLVAALGDNVPVEMPEAMRRRVADATPTEDERQIAQQLSEADDAVLVLGNLALASPQAASLRAWGSVLAAATGAAMGELPHGANSAGAWAAGAVPHRVAGGEALEHAGLDARAMLERGLKGYLLLGLEPEFDCWDGAAAIDALSAAEAVVCVTPFVTEQMKAYASVLLPAATFGETSGTFVNAEGLWQSFPGAAPPQGEARPAWKILRVLGNWLQLDGFDYLSSDEVLAQLREHIGEVAVDYSALRTDESAPAPAAGSLVRIGERPIYSVDALVRRSPALQETPLGAVAEARVSPADAERLGLQDGAQVKVAMGERSVTLPLRVEPSLAEGAVWVPVGIEATAALGASFGSITLSQV